MTDLTAREDAFRRVREALAQIISVAGAGQTVSNGFAAADRLYFKREKVKAQRMLANCNAQERSA